MKLGIDKGSVLTKTTKFQFKSIVSELSGDSGITLLERAGVPIRIGKHHYVFGESGEFALDMAKGEDENTKLLIYAAIIMAKPTQKEKVDIVVGLPFGQYTRQKEAMIELLSSDKPIDYTYEGEDSKFSLGKVAVFPEGAGVYYSQDTSKFEGKRVLIVDIGGISVDVAFFNDRKLVSYASYPLGIMKLYSKMSTEINRQFQTEYTEWDMDTILKKELGVEGQTIRKDFLDELSIEHTKTIFQKIKREYDIRSMDEVQLAGGGGELLHEHLYDLIPQALLVPNPVLANVSGFQKVAEVMFNEGN